MQEYNGWENKFTWMVHLHLSNEYHLMHEITALVASEQNEGSAGRLVEMWVKVALSNWLTCFPGRDRQHDEEMRLFAWDLVGSALAYADWDGLVVLFTGTVQRNNNPFTRTLFNCIMRFDQLREHVWALLGAASSVYVAADVCKEWLTEQVDMWMDTPVAQHQTQTPISVVCQHLIQDIYSVISWEHVARAFRPDY